MAFAQALRQRLLHYPFVKKPPRDLSSPTFWNNFYNTKADNEPFEWFLSAATVGETVLQSTSQPERLNDILHVGAGTSEVGPWMQNNSSSINTVVNVDFDPLSCELMAKRFPYQTWECCALGSKEQPKKWNKAFDLVLDKGTLDAVLFGGLEPTIEYTVGIEKALKDDGMMLQLTDESPETRHEFLALAFPPSAWNISCSTILENGQETASSFNDGKEHYCYKIWRK